MRRRAGQQPRATPSQTSFYPSTPIASCEKLTYLARLLPIVLSGFPMDLFATQPCSCSSGPLFRPGLATPALTRAHAPQLHLLQSKAPRVFTIFHLTQFTRVL